jgi:hypothetical protein
MSDLLLGSAPDGSRVLVEAADFTTHGVILGMTGSGKTGMSVVLIEELLKSGVPVIAVDPKGDLGNLLLPFPALSAAEFQPWVDPEAARRQGESVEAAAEAAAARWRDGLQPWGIGPEQVRAYLDGHESRILTPGSSAGVPVNLVDSLAPPASADSDDELSEAAEASVSALLGLLDVDADPVSSPEYILLHTLILGAWRKGEKATLEDLVAQVARPPVDKLGALPLETFYPEKERRKLMLALNGLLASPSFAAWRTGVPLDIAAWLRADDGRPRLSVVYTAHLPDNQRLSFTALLLERLILWMRAQPGTSELRALLYIDEVFGYFPPVAEPPTKKPLLTLFKTARAFGLGVVLATQNPVDIDYRGLSNIGAWFVGRLQTEQDRSKVVDGLRQALPEAAGRVEELLADLPKRTFVFQDIHRGEATLLTSRWAMSYLRGPLTEDEIARLTDAEPHSQPEEATAAVEPATTVALPALPGEMRHLFLRLHGMSQAEARLLVRAAVRMDDHLPEQKRALAFAVEGRSLSDLLEGNMVDVSGHEFAEARPHGVTLGEAEASVLAATYAQLERAVKARLDDRLARTVLYDPVTKTTAGPGETADELALRIGDLPAIVKRRDALLDRLDDLRAKAAAERAELEARQNESLGTLGSTLLDNLGGLFTGRKRKITGVSGVLSKQRLERASQARLDRYEAQADALERDLAELDAVDPARFETRSVKPSSADVSLLGIDLLWLW